MGTKVVLTHQNQRTIVIIRSTTTEEKLRIIITKESRTIPTQDYTVKPNE